MPNASQSWCRNSWAGHARRHRSDRGPDRHGVSAGSRGPRGADPRADDVGVGCRSDRAEAASKRRLGWRGGSQTLSPLPNRRGSWSIVAVVLVVELTAYKMADDTSTCLGCHERTTASVQAYQDGPHATVRCFDCDSSPGAFGGAAGRLQYARWLAGGSPHAPESPAFTPDSACLACHEARHGEHFRECEPSGASRRLPRALRVRGLPSVRGPRGVYARV